jgi:protein O-mannosyl-transferase
MRQAVEQHRSVSTSRSTTIGTWPSRSILLSSLLLVALTVVCYAPAIDNGFVNLDDDLYVVHNPHVQNGLNRENLAWAFTTFDTENWHPLTWLSLQLDASLFGAGSRAFHTTNVALHAINGVLLFLALARLTGRQQLAAIVAAIFVVHPLHVESVAWVSERKDVLSAFFGLLALLIYASANGRMSVRRELVISLLYAASLLAKPMLVTLPFLLLLLDWWPLGRLAAVHPEAGERRIAERVWVLVREKVPMFLLSGISCWVTWLAQRTAAASSLALVPFWSRIENALVSYAAYLVQTFYPLRLAAFYPLEVNSLSAEKVIASALLLGLITIVCLGRLRSQPYLLAGWLWYLGTLVPVIGLVQVGPQARADRYTYLPAVGIYIMVVWAIDDLAARFRLRKAAVALGVPIVILLAVLCRAQVETWHDDFSLFQHMLRITGDSWMACWGLGVAEEREGHLSKAIEEYEKAVRLNPRKKELLARLGSAYHAAQRYSDARRFYEKALEIDPRDARVHANLGAALRSLGDPTGALAHLREAVELEPNRPETALAYFNMGAIFEGQGNREEAIRAYRRAVNLNPSDQRSKARLAVIDKSGN